MKNEFLHRYISRTSTRGGTDNFIDQLFFKNTYFAEHLSVAVTIKIVKAMSNLIVIKLSEFVTCNYPYIFSTVYLEPSYPFTIFAKQVHCRCLAGF